MVSDVRCGAQVNSSSLEERLKPLYEPALLSGLLAFSAGFCDALSTAQKSTAGSFVAVDPSRQDVTVAFGVAVLTGLLGAIFIGYQAYRSFDQRAQDDRMTQELLKDSGARFPSKIAAANRRHLPTSPLNEASTLLGSPRQLACLAALAPEQLRPAASSNYGRREPLDWRGQPVEASPSLIVLHETVVDESTTLDLFSRDNASDDQQASYHVLIAEDGRRLRVVDDSQRAFGAGDSVFNGQAVKLKPDAAPSVNNFALHVSLVTPADGRDGEARSHLGYTKSQYRSLAAQVAYWMRRYGIKPAAIATHAQIDRSGTRRDPRSLDIGKLNQSLSEVVRTCS